MAYRHTGYSTHYKVNLLKPPTTQTPPTSRGLLSALLPTLNTIPAAWLCIGCCIPEVHTNVPISRCSLPLTWDNLGGQGVREWRCPVLMPSGRFKVVTKTNGHSRSLCCVDSHPTLLHANRGQDPVRLPVWTVLLAGMRALCPQILLLVLTEMSLPDFSRGCLGASPRDSQAFLWVIQSQALG